MSLMVLMVLINFGSFRTIQTSSCLPSATLRSWAFAPYPKAGAGMIFSDVISGLERVSDHATNIAFAITAEEKDDDPEME